MMKITAGMGSIDEYESFVKAGADELFAGYVPQRWMENKGQRYPLNRREVLYYNVQLGSRSELEILSDMVRKEKKPVSITLNSLVYPKEQYPMLLQIIEECMACGFFSFIIADVTLLWYLNKLPKNMRERMQIHLSGECGEVNTQMLKELGRFGINRVIFPRKTGIASMKSMILKTDFSEYEAFALNEMCHYSGSFCNSLHCDELVPVCRLPYRLERAEEKNGFFKSDQEKDPVQRKREEADTELEEAYLPGRSGCALCSLWDLKEIGVTHLKLVSRGNYVEDTLKDIQALKRACCILEESPSKEAYITCMKQELFRHGCSGQCYYL